MSGNTSESKPVRTSALPGLHKSALDMWENILRSHDERSKPKHDSYLTNVSERAERLRKPSHDKIESSGY